MRRIVVLVIVILLGVPLISFAAAMSAPSNSPFGVRVIEWLRDNGRRAGLEHRGRLHTWTARVHRRATARGAAQGRAHVRGRRQRLRSTRRSSP
jgi:hypothetical protein